MTPITKSALDIAISQVGQTESPLGSNWGHPVQDYLATVGLHFPASWCMAFLYWCFDKAALKLNTVSPLDRTGGVHLQWNARKENQIYSGPQVGDIFIMDLGHQLGHTGIIESLNPDNSLNTIEGNTNHDGSRNGVDVEKKRRQQGKPIIGYLRF